VATMVQNGAPLICPSRRGRERGFRQQGDLAGALVEWAAVAEAEVSGRGGGGVCGMKLGAACLLAEKERRGCRQ
jgi:hypothetical protein